MNLFPAAIVLFVTSLGAQQPPLPPLGTYFNPWIEKAKAGDPLAIMQIVEELRATFCRDFDIPCEELIEYANPLLKKLADEGNAKACGWYAENLFRDEDRVERLKYAQKGYEKGDYRSAMILRRDERDERKKEQHLQAALALRLEGIRRGDADMIDNACRSWHVTGLSDKELSDLQWKQAALGNRWAMYTLTERMACTSPSRLIEEGLCPPDVDPSTLTAAMVGDIVTDLRIQAAQKQHYKAAFSLAGGGTGPNRAVSRSGEEWYQEAIKMLGAEPEDPDGPESEDVEEAAAVEAPPPPKAAKPKPQRKSTPPRTGTASGKKGAPLAKKATAKAK